jgi:hypothetical protein
LTESGRISRQGYGATSSRAEALEVACFEATQQQSGLGFYRTSLEVSTVCSVSNAGNWFEILMRARSPRLVSLLMPPRRLEDRIKELCARLLMENEPEWSSTAQELQLALQEHILRIANLTTALIVAKKTTEERRKT